MTSLNNIIARPSNEQSLQQGVAANLQETHKATDVIVKGILLGP